MATAKKAVATTTNQYPTDAPAFLNPDTGRGNEAVDASSMVIPRLVIVQDLSPQHKKNKPEYIEGAEPGMVFNTVTNELYGQSFKAIPVIFRKEQVIWKDINSGGGFKGAYPTVAEAEAALKELEDADKCEIVETNQQFVMLINEDGSLTEAVISMSKSQNRISRQLNTILQSVGYDRFAHVIEFRAVEAQNAAGQDYYNWRVDRMGFCTEEQYRRAEKLYDAIREGAADVSRDPDTTSSGPEVAQGDVDDAEHEM